MTTLETVLAAAALSMLGGIAAARRRAEGDWNAIITYALNLSVLGASIAWCCAPFIEAKSYGSSVVIGLTGIASLNGLRAIDWATHTVRKIVERQTSSGKSDAEPTDSDRSDDGGGSDA